MVVDFLRTNCRLRGGAHGLQGEQGWHGEAPPRAGGEVVRRVAGSQGGSEEDAVRSVREQLEQLGVQPTTPTCARWYERSAPARTARAQSGRPVSYRPSPHVAEAWVSSSGEVSIQ